MSRILTEFSLEKSLKMKAIEKSYAGYREDVKEKRLAPKASSDPTKVAALHKLTMNARTQKHLQKASNSQSTKGPSTSGAQYLFKITVVEINGPTEIKQVMSWGGGAGFAFGSNYVLLKVFQQLYEQLVIPWWVKMNTLELTL